MAEKRKDRSKSIPLSSKPSRRYVRYCFVLAMAGMVALAWLSLLTFSPYDAPSKEMYPPQPTENAAGVVGAYLAYGLRYWVGSGAYMGLLFASAAAVVLIMGGKLTDASWRIAGLALLVTATSASAYLLQEPQVGEVFHGSAGILGAGSGEFLRTRLGNIGAWITLIVALCIGLMLTVENLMLKIPHLGKKAWKRRDRLGGMINNIASTVRPIAATKKPVETPKPARLPVAPMLPTPKPPQPTKPPVKDAAPQKKPLQLPTKPDYALPSAELLAEPSTGYAQTQELQAAHKRLVLQQTLDDFNIEAKAVGYQTGPVITLFELSLAAGVKVAQVASLANDIARALAVPGVRIVSPLPGRDTIGVEVPNMDKEIVRIKELMGLAPEAEKSMMIPLYLGKDAGGNPIIADLAAMPHMLIAGTTGSGKSVCINSIIMAILLMRRPEDVRLILVDPKMVEMAAFEEIPHLLCPIVNDMRHAEDMLEWAADKMDLRYELLKEANVKNIIGFNELGEEEIYKRLGAETEEEKEQIITHLPYYVIIVDELADLIMTSSKEVENHIIRIAQKARAVGIHLLLATQRPSANVVTGLIKSNMPCRASFRVASRQESRIVLDQNGAEVLMGQGDMLFLQPGTSNLIRAQGTFVDDTEINSVVKQLRKSRKPQYNPELIKIHSKPTVGESGERDELFNKAVEIVLGSGRGSVSLIQRRLQIGYSRASRIIDQMAEAGLLGDYKGSQARECLMSVEDWQDLQASIAADQSGASSLNGEPTSA